jgi:hypothetical protein
MRVLQEETPLNEKMPIKKKSKLRAEIEALLEKKGLVVEEKISVMNLESEETYHFDDYHEALQFLKGRKGRWYLTTAGIRSVKKDP